MIAAIITWITPIFLLTDNIYTVLGHHPLMASSSSLVLLSIGNFVGSIIAAVVVATSYNAFHRIRLNHI